VIKAGRQELAAPPPEIEIEGLGAHVAGRAGDRRHHGGPVGRDDVAQGQAAGADLREVVVEPRRQRGVHVDDGAERVDREEARRRMIEVIDGVLQLLKHVLLPLAFVRHVRDRPQRRPAPAGPRHRADPHPVPAELPRAAQVRRQADLLGRGPMLAGGLGEAIDCFGHLRRAGEHALDRTEIGRPLRARQRHVAFVGVDDPPVVVGHHEPLARRVRHQLGEVVARALAGELHGADRQGEEEENARHGEQREQPEDERLRLLGGHEPQADRRSDQNARKQEQQADMARPLRPVDGGTRQGLAVLSHEDATSFPLRLMMRAAAAARPPPSVPRPFRAVSPLRRPARASPASRPFVRCGHPPRGRRRDRQSGGGAIRLSEKAGKFPASRLRTG
jgi:hypothetical protein